MSARKRLMSASNTRAGKQLGQGLSGQLFANLHTRTNSGRLRQSEQDNKFVSKKFSAVLALNREASKNKIKTKGFLSAANSRKQSANRIESAKQTVTGTVATQA